MVDLISREEVLKLPQRKGYAVNGWETYIRVSDIKELSPVQSEQELLKDGTLVVKTDFDMTKFDRVNVIQNGTHYGDLFYQDDDTRRTGKWIDYSDEGYVECPFCHSATNCDGNKDELHYCFSCGADMRSEAREYLEYGKLIDNGDVGEGKLLDYGRWHICYDQTCHRPYWVKAWMPLPEPYKEREE